jgi:hypothetical protein
MFEEDQNFASEIGGSHGSEDVDCGLLRCDAT